MTSAHVSVVVCDQAPRGFEASLLTTEDAHVLIVGVSRPQTHKVTKPPFDPLALPENKFQCVHTDVEREELEGDKVRFNAVRCVNSLSDTGGYLCGYHERRLLGRRLSKPEADKLAQSMNDLLYDEVPAGIIAHDTKAITAYPIKRLNGLRVQAAPAVPMIKANYIVRSDWEKVELNK